MFKQLLTILSLWHLFGCAQAGIFSDKKTVTTQDARQSFVGTWYKGYETSNGTEIEVSIENFDDGTYRKITKKTYVGGYSENNFELGQWGISGPVYFTTKRGIVEGCTIISSDRTSSNVYNAYQTAIVKGDEWRLSHIESRSGRQETYFKMDNAFNLAKDHPALEGCAYISKSLRKKPAKA